MNKPTKLSERISVLASKFPNGSLLADTDPVAFIDLLITRSSAVEELVKVVRRFCETPFSSLTEHEIRTRLEAALKRYEEGK